jgi:hypothetical protein
MFHKPLLRNLTPGLHLLICQSCFVWFFDKREIRIPLYQRDFPVRLIPQYPLELILEKYPVPVDDIPIVRSLDIMSAYSSFSFTGYLSRSE